MAATSIVASSVLRRALPTASMKAAGSMAAAPMNNSMLLARRTAVTTKTKAASPETPLLHYTATQQATSSINHRIFWVNVIFMIFVADAGSALVDL
mmetsp:Transcript_4062/g.5727  ORF Transcript_4062/g.5727 Transcript_4062/m.5727 type:complete len:96 (+) Transcript_4062:98-385(+)|eukprot:CAMPEP_0206442126 /NCGR_PEP_ID=MMETSP0324_2-20121206/13650_1 /ASSEMBLY_ACC=CAM_ASM_000836 /TAXON_ID=2866 /ORGANISM="Crypthecodinium cohnii, Strain Seligo" /LENGTH=95 /DNA_ID=CAMNT_0053909937 /DNA_START=99 /DNA_END=386 /DNA_ORIENTATION=-